MLIVILWHQQQQLLLVFLSCYSDVELPLLWRAQRAQKTSFLHISSGSFSLDISEEDLLETWFEESHIMKGIPRLFNNMEEDRNHQSNSVCSRIVLNDPQQQLSTKGRHYGARRVLLTIKVQQQLTWPFETSSILSFIQEKTRDDPGLPRCSTISFLFLAPTVHNHHDSNLMFTLLDLLDFRATFSTAGRFYLCTVSVSCLGSLASFPVAYALQRPCAEPWRSV